MRHLLVLLSGLTLLLASLAAVALRWSLQEIRHPHGSFVGGRVVEISAGTSAGSALQQLESAGVISRAWLARLYLVHVLGDQPIQKGEYLFEEPLSVPEVLDHLVQGRVILHPVTVIEGLTLWETAQHLANQGFGSEELFVEAMEDPSLIADLDPDAGNLEGYLYPDSYRFQSGTTEQSIAATMVATFRDRIRELPVSDNDLSLRELVILASIVEKEARLDEERPLIASVYRNRLDRGMGLYADPTVIYALKLQGTWDGDIRRADLEMESPYNTYRQRGLPPSPICSPGVKSLAAATAPADSPYLYFVSKNDGTHVFATTLSDHNRNVFRWQKQYWRNRRVQEPDTQD